MLKKMIIGIILSGLLLATAVSVSAADEEKFFQDPEDDVINFITEELTDQRPNIDIIEITYSKTGREVTITLKVKGQIENRGDLEDEESYNAVSYSIELYTTDEAYLIEYMNEECTLNGEFDGISFDIYGNGDTIEFKFNLESSSERYVNIGVMTFDVVVAGTTMEMFSDEFADISEELIVDAGGPYTGKVGESIKFSGKASGGDGKYSWSWDFDGDYEPDATVQNPSYTFNEEGTYEIILIVEDSQGSYGYDETTVVISGFANGSGDESGGGSGLIIFIILIVVIVVIAAVALIYIKKR